eukprot:RCo040124
MLRFPHRRLLSAALGARVARGLRGNATSSWPGAPTPAGALTTVGGRASGKGSAAPGPKVQHPEKEKEEEEYFPEPMPCDPMREVRPNDKYLQTSGWAYMTGLQVLVRLPIVQRQLDAQHGLNTAGYVSGYRGSPLASYDSQLWSAKKVLRSHHVTFHAAVNEELAATSCWGTQQVGVSGESKYDGVFSIWYGKGPGVDRTGDAFRHATRAGTA